MKLLWATVAATLVLSILVKYGLPQWVTGYTTPGIWMAILTPVSLIAVTLAWRWR